MASTGTDTARFVITGEFNAANLIKDVEAKIGQLAKAIETKMATVGPSISRSISDGMNQGVAGATATASRGAAGIAHGMSDVEEGTDGVSKNMKKINADIFTAVKRVLLWGAASRLIFDTYGRIKDSVKDVVELNRILVNIQKIRPAGLDVDFIGDDIIAKAKRFGVAFEEIGETQRTFFQQGFNTVQVSKLTEAQLLAVTAAGLSASEAMELLVSSMTIFGIEATKSISLIDKLQKVQANFAVSTQDIATAMRRVGPVAEQLGGDIDHLIGVITALKTSTRKSGEFIGTALSTIFSRAITDVGANQLRRIGVDINETATQLRPLRDILNETAIKWKELSDQEKIATAFALGARRRYAQVIALFEEYPTVLEASASSTNAFGAALIAQEKEVQSVSRQMAIATQTAREAGIAFINAFSSTGKITDDFVKFAKVLQSLAGSVKKAAPVLAFLAKIAGFATTVAVFNVAARVMQSRFAELSLKAIIGAGAVNTYNTAVATGIARTTALGVAMLSINWYAIVGAALVMGAAWLKLNSIMKSHENQMNDLSDAYINFENQSDVVKKTLSDYRNIVKQFNEVGGKQDYVDLLGPDFSGEAGIIGALERITAASGGVNNATFKDWVAAVEEVKGKGYDLEEAYDSLSNVIGFMQATSSGVRKELEAMQSQANDAVASITTLAINLGQVLDERNDYDQNRFFKEYFGYDSAKDLLNDFNKIAKSIEVLDIAGGVTSGDADKATASLFDDIYKQFTEGATDSEFKKLVNEYGAYGELAGRLLIENLVEASSDPKLIRKVLSGGDKFTIEQALKLDLNIDEISDEELKKVIEKTTKGLTNKDLMYETFKKQLKGKDINIAEFLLGDPDLSELESVSKDIAQIVESDMPDVFKRLQNDVNPFLELLIQVQLKAREISGSAGFLPKNVTTTFKNFTTFINDTNTLAESFAHASKTSEAFGKSLSELQLGAISKQVKAAITQLSKVDAIEEQAASYERTRLAYLDYAKVLAEDPNKNQRKITALAKLQDALAQKIVDTEVEQAYLNKTTKDGESILAKATAQYELYLDFILTVKETYKETSSELKVLNASELKRIAVIEKHEKALAKLGTQIKNLYTGGSFAETLANDLNLVTKSYDIQRRAVEGRIKAEDELYKKRLIALDTEYEFLSVDQKTGQATGDYKKTKEYRNQAKQLEIANNEKVAGLQYSLQLLDLEEENRKSIVSTTNEIKQRTAIQKANLDSIKEFYDAMQKADEAAVEFSTSVAGISAEFSRLDTGGSFFKELSISQALITREQQLQSQAIQKQIKDIKSQVVARQNEYKIGQDLLSSDVGRSRTLTDTKNILEGMNLEAKKGLNQFVLEARARLEAKNYALEQLGIQTEYNHDIAILNDLLERANALFEANATSVKNVAAGMNATITATLAYNKSAQGILKTFELLGKNANFGEALTVELNAINRSYDQQQQALKAQTTLVKERIKAEQRLAGYNGDVLSAQLEIMDIKKENLNVSEEEADAAYDNLNSIALKGQGELQVLEIKEKQLEKDREHAKNLAEMNTLLKLAKQTQADINQLAAGYADSFADIITNIGDIINERGSMRTILEPFADAYVNSVTSRLSNSLQTYLNGVLESSVGGQLAKLEEALRKKTEAEPYEVGGEIIQQKLLEGLYTGASLIKQAELEGHTIGANIVKQSIIEANSSQVTDPTTVQVGEEVQGTVDSQSYQEVGNALQQQILEGLYTGGAFIKQAEIEGHIIGANLVKQSLLDAYAAQAPVEVKQTTEESETPTATLTQEDVDAYQIAVPDAKIAPSSFDTAGSTIVAAHTEGAEIVYARILAAFQDSGQTTVPLPSDTIPEVGSLNLDPVESGLNGVQTGVAGMTTVQGQNVQATEKTTEEMAKQVQKQRLTVAAIQGLGVIMGNLVGGGGQGAGIGASVGGIAGSFLGPIGGAIGSVLGGALGGLFDSGEDEAPKDPVPPAIYEANYEALKQNTQALLSNAQNFDFMRKLLNAPANFIQPAFAGVGGGANITVQINAPVGNENAVGNAVYNAVSKVYSSDYRRFGRRG